MPADRLSLRSLTIALFEYLRDTPPTWATVTPGEAFEPSPLTPWQRGTVLLAQPEVVAFGNGATSTAEGIYQVDLFHPTTPRAAWLVLARADVIVERFHPVARRGLVISRDSTRAIIRELPRAQLRDAEGAWIGATVEVQFTVDDDPA